MEDWDKFYLKNTPRMLLKFIIKIFGVADIFNFEIFLQLEIVKSFE